MTTTCAEIPLNLLAYIGPGGGIALLGPLLGVIVAAVGALLMIALWPLRIVMRKRSQRTTSGDSIHSDGQQTQQPSVPVTGASQPSRPA